MMERCVRQVWLCECACCAGVRRASLRNPELGSEHFCKGRKSDPTPNPAARCAVRGVRGRVGFMQRAVKGQLGSDHFFAASCEKVL